jgi:hypothetical protein
MLVALALLAAMPIGQDAAASSIDLDPELLSTTSCEGTACAADVEDRYRLPLPVERAPNPAARAFDEDGRECGLIGHTVCTGKAHRIVGSGEHADESLTAKLRALDE